MFSILVVAMVSRVYSYIQTYQVVYVKCVQLFCISVIPQSKKRSCSYLHQTQNANFNSNLKILIYLLSIQLWVKTTEKFLFFICFHSYNCINIHDTSF